MDLPSEAEWEAAARGKDGWRFPWEGEAEPTPEFAKYGDDWETGRPALVGSYEAAVGPFGTLDQAGNVWEWCWDEFKEDAYKGRDGQRNPVEQGDETDTAASRVFRGGSWYNPSGYLRAAIRSGVRAGSRDRYLGFRVVCRSGPEHGS